MANRLPASAGETNRSHSARAEEPPAREGNSRPAPEPPRVGEQAWVLDGARVRIAAERLAIARELKEREVGVVAAAAAGDHAAWNRHRTRRFQLLGRLRTLEEEARRLGLQFD